MTEPFALRAWNRLAGYAAGRYLFSKIVCWKAPYFATIAPRFERLERWHAEVRLRKRRRVQNHLGTVHAIAMANLCEVAAGTMLEATVPPSHRWIPRGMRIDYLAKASTDLRVTASATPLEFSEAVDVPVICRVVDTNGQEVVRATIDMYISPRR